MTTKYWKTPRKTPSYFTVSDDLHDNDMFFREIEAWANIRNDQFCGIFNRTFSNFENPNLNTQSDAVVAVSET